MSTSSSKDERRIRADQIFDAALDLTPAERAAYVANACGTDLELFDLVHRLLDGAETESSSFAADGLGASLWDGVFEQLTRQNEAVAEGTVLGRYRVVREIGRGGMAVVVLAERADGQFEQQVALKLIRRGVNTAEVIRRFDQERQILARAHHPNIAQLIDGGVGPDGSPYLVMEYVEGRSIDRYADEERLGIEERLELFLQVARAVGYAHRNLVVHRDIKPSNTLVTADGHVKLLDFGIAKLVDDDASAGEALTHPESRVMTPLYASPEQVRGGPVTTASDIYQLGLLLYMLLCGRWPYRVPDDEPLEVVRAISNDPPTRPSVALADLATHPPRGLHVPPSAAELSAARAETPARLRRRLAGDLDAVVLMALHKEPERRYGSVAQLITDVEAVLAERPVAARGGALRYRFGKLVRRHRAAAATATAALVLIVALALFYTLQLARERDRAQLAAAQATQVSNFLRGLFEVSAPTRSKGEQITARQLLDRGARRVEDELASQPDVQADMMTLIGGVYSELALYEEARPLIDRAVAIRRRDAAADPLPLAESLEVEGRLRAALGQHAAAEERLREALAIRERGLGARHPAVARTLNGLGEVRKLQGDFPAAQQYHERALEILEAAYGLDHPEVGLTLERLGQVLEEVRAYAPAEARLKRALTILEQRYEPDHPYLAETRLHLADVLRATGDAAGARTLYERALPVIEQSYGPEHPAVAEVLDKLGKVLNAMNESDGAVAYHQRALAIREAALGPGHPQVAASLNNLGLALWRRGDLEAARQSFARSVEVFEGALGRDHVELAPPLLNLGDLLYQTEARAEVRPLYQRVIEIRERAYGPDHSFLAAPLFKLGSLELDLGDPAAAEPLLRRALALGRDQEPLRHPEVILPRIAMARCLTALGRYEEAEELLRRNLDEGRLDVGAHRFTLLQLVEVAEKRRRPHEAAVARAELAALEATSEGG